MKLSNVLVALAMAASMTGCAALQNAAEPGREQRLAQCKAVSTEISSRDATPTPPAVDVTGRWRCVNNTYGTVVFWQVAQSGSDYIANFSHAGNNGTFKGRIDGDRLIYSNPASDEMNLLQISNVSMEGYGISEGCNVGQLTCMRL